MGSAGALVAMAAVVVGVAAAAETPAYRAATASSAVPYCADPTKYNSTLDAMLIDSTDMPAQISSMVVAVPTEVLVDYLCVSAAVFAIGFRD